MQRPKPIIHSEIRQRSEEWHNLRLGKVTGSRVKEVILTVSDTQRLAAIRKILQISAVNAKVKASPEFLELWELDPFELLDRAEMEVIETEKRRSYRENMVGERLTGLPADPEPFMTHDMKWGVINEDMAITLYQLQNRCIVEPAPFYEHPELKCGASPDGICTDMTTGEIGIVEVKCLRSANHLFKIIATQEVPDDYYDQIQMQMWITGYDWCDFIGFDSRLPEGLKIFTKRVPFNEEYVSTVLEPNVRRFLDEAGRAERRFRKLIREGKKQNDNGGNENNGRAAADMVDAKNAPAL